jgi:surface polysaccharide O-acyltransferase-like enzyme
MELNKEISQRITYLRFPLIIGIVFIHTPATTVQYSDVSIGLETATFITSFIHGLISGVFAAVSVPMFFLISGFLFFSGYDNRFATYKAKIKKRIRSLLIPYLIWNFFALLFYFILQSIPDLRVFFSGNSKHIVDYTFYDFLNAFLGIQITSNSPIAYQFWFIRDLMLLVLFAPLFKLTSEKIPKTGFFIFFLIWVLNIQYKFPNLSNAAVFFFYLGCFISGKNALLLNRNGISKFIVPVYLVCAILDASLLDKHLPSHVCMHKLILLLGIVSAWHLSGLIHRDSFIDRILTSISPFSFFVYAAHEPFLLAGIIKIIYYIFRPSNAPIVIFLYFFSPFLTILILIYIGKLFSSSSPPIYRILTGNRIK